MDAVGPSVNVASATLLTWVRGAGVLCLALGGLASLGSVDPGLIRGWGATRFLITLGLGIAWLRKWRIYAPPP